MAKKKKLLKKLAKAALIGGGLYAATRGLKGRADKLTEGDIGLGLRPPRVDDYNNKPKKVVDNKEEFFIYKPKFIRSKSQKINKDNAFGKLSELRFR